MIIVNKPGISFYDEHGVIVSVKPKKEKKVFIELFLAFELRKKIKKYLKKVACHDNCHSNQFEKVKTTSGLVFIQIKDTFIG